MGGFDDGQMKERGLWLTMEEMGTWFYSCEDLNSAPAGRAGKEPLSSR